MIHRLQAGAVPAKHHIAFYQQDKLMYEHCFTRQGFEGSYSILYHPDPPHYIETEEDMGLHPGFSDPEPISRPLRRHFISDQIPNGGSAFLGRELIMSNSDMGVWFAVADQPDPALACNMDGDEMVFVFSGSGTLYTPFGKLTYGKEDYVCIPRGVVHRWVPDEPSRLLIMECRSWMDIPKQFRNAAGQLRMDAPYCHRDFLSPEWRPDQVADHPSEVLVKRQNYLTRQCYVHHPFDVVGWDGQVWPFVFPIRCFEPKVGLTHLPPTIHGTFAGGGFLICSFVPRLVDFHPQAVPCPYPHSSVDCDEFIFYIEGNFTSRKGVGPGSMSLHPAGLPHGPHPGTYEASIGHHETSEMAVMIDTFKPLYPSQRANRIEEQDYQMSWIKP